MQDEDNCSTHILFAESPSGKTIWLERVICFLKLGQPKARSIRRPTLPALATIRGATSSAPSSTTPTCHSAIRTLHFSFAVVPLIVVAYCITLTQTFGTVALLDVDEDILSASIWRDEAEALVVHELFHCTSQRHCWVAGFGLHFELSSWSNSS